MIDNNKELLIAILESQLKVKMVEVLIRGKYPNTQNVNNECLKAEITELERQLAELKKSQTMGEPKPHIHEWKYFDEQLRDSNDNCFRICFDCKKKQILDLNNIWVDLHPIKNESQINHKQ